MHDLACICGWHNNAKWALKQEEYQKDKGFLEKTEKEINLIELALRAHLNRLRLKQNSTIKKIREEFNLNI